MDKEILSRLVSCYGTKGFHAECPDCPLAVVCHLYSKKHIFNILAKHLALGDLSYQNRLEKLLSSHSHCEDMAKQNVLKSDELLLIDLASKLNLSVCRRCEGCAIKIVLSDCCDFEKQLKLGNVPSVSSHINFPPEHCPYLVEHLVSKDG